MMKRKTRVLVSENSTEDMSDYRKQNSSPMDTGCTVLKRTQANIGSMVLWRTS